MKQLLSITTHYGPPFPETHGAAGISCAMPGLPVCLAAVRFKQDACRVTLKSTVRLEVEIVSTLSPQHCHLSLTPPSPPLQGQEAPTPQSHPCTGSNIFSFHRPPLLFRPTSHGRLTTAWKIKRPPLPRAKETEKLQK